MRYLALLLTVAACGDNVGGVALGDYLERSAEAECTSDVRCGLFPDAPTCLAYVHVAVDPNPTAAVAAGKLTYSGANARACIDALAAASCDLTDRSERVEPPACMRVFTGRLPEGEACAFSSECVSLDCMVPTCSDACCPGTCGPSTPLAKIGESCTATGCVDDAFCDDTATCRALLAMGSTCNDQGQCQYGLGCVGLTPGVPGTCGPLPKIGESCPDHICSEVGAVCNATGTCVAMGLPGDACSVDLDCSFYFHCDATQHCAPYPTLGMTCIDRCSDASWCNVPAGQTMGTCDPLLANGQACSRTTQCASYFCDTSASPAVCTDIPVCI
jgi:hypothetical protein